MLESILTKIYLNLSNNAKEDQSIHAVEITLFKSSACLFLRQMPLSS